MSDNEINYLVQQYSKGSMPDYQMSAFLMAVYLNGLNDRVHFTYYAMLLCSILDLTYIQVLKGDLRGVGINYPLSLRLL